MGIFFGKDREISYFGFIKKQRNIYLRQNLKYFITLSSRIGCIATIRKSDDSVLQEVIVSTEIRKNYQITVRYRNIILTT